MAIKYKCPFCDTLYDDEYDAEDCRNECAKDEYPVIEIDNVKDAKADPAEFVGKCGTCRNCDIRGRTFVDCQRCGIREPDDGCDAYVPDTITFGMQIETLWNEQKEARA